MQDAKAKRMQSIRQALSVPRSAEQVSLITGIPLKSLFRLFKEMPDVALAEQKPCIKHGIYTLQTESDAKDGSQKQAV